MKAAVGDVQLPGCSPDRGEWHLWAMTTCFGSRVINPGQLANAVAECLELSSWTSLNRAENTLEPWREGIPYSSAPIL